MGSATEERVGASPSPKTEEGVVVWIGEVDSERQPVQPRQPDAQGSKVGPEVSHVIVHHKVVLETLSKGAFRLSVAVNDEWLLVHCWNLATVQ